MRLECYVTQNTLKLFGLQHFQGFMNKPRMLEKRVVIETMNDEWITGLRALI